MTYEFKTTYAASQCFFIDTLSCVKLKSIS